MHVIRNCIDVGRTIGPFRFSNARRAIQTIPIFDYIRQHILRAVEISVYAKPKA